MAVSLLAVATMSTPLLDLSPLQAQLRAFAQARGWEPHHTPRNLLLALVGEVGELAEILQWRSDAELATLAQDTPDAWTHLGEELADVQIYLARLADVLGVDMAAAVADKQAKNARKYPEPQA